MPDLTTPQPVPSNSQEGRVSLAKISPAVAECIRTMQRTGLPIEMRERRQYATSHGGRACKVQVSCTFTVGNRQIAPGTVSRIEQEFAEYFQQDGTLSELGQRLYVARNGKAELLDSGEAVADRYRQDRDEAERKHRAAIRFPILYLNPGTGTLYVVDNHEERDWIALRDPVTNDSLLQLMSRPVQDTDTDVTPLYEARAEKP